VTHIFKAIGWIGQFLETFTILAVINENFTVILLPACSSTAFKGGVFSKSNFSWQALGILLDKNNSKAISFDNLNSRFCRFNRSFGFNWFTFFGLPFFRLGTITLRCSIARNELIECVIGTVLKSRGARSTLSISNEALTIICIVVEEIARLVFKASVSTFDEGNKCWFSSICDTKS
jgi:hypothetical protein